MDPTRGDGLSARSEEVLAKCHAAQRRVDHAFEIADPFTRNERRILRYLIQGRQTKDIAPEMEISEAAVRAHIRAFCLKAGVTGATEALLFGIQQPQATRRGAACRRGLHAVSPDCACAHCHARREVA